MKNKLLLILSLLFMVNFSMSCYVNTDQDNPFDPANIDVLSDEDAVTTDKLNTSIVYNGTDTSTGVKQNITLPVTGANGTTISWSSSNPAVVSNNGVVLRPDFSVGDVIVTIVATISRNSSMDTRTFTIKVLKLPATDAGIVMADKNELEIQYSGSDTATSVTQNVTLLTTGTNGSTISWATSNLSVITIFGNVYRPRNGNASVTLTATIECNTASDTKSFLITVIEKPYAIGEMGPSGGYVFYDKGSYSTDGNGYWRYLEAAKVDQSTGAVWYSGYATTGATGVVIGTGKTNTSAIIATQGVGIYAATICTAYRGGGYNDWFLPSREELKKMYTNLKLNNIGGFADTDYYCSTEYSASDAWFIRLDNGTSGTYYKTYSRYVRAIRAF